MPKETNNNASLYYFGVLSGYLRSLEVPEHIEEACTALEECMGITSKPTNKTQPVKAADDEEEIEEEPRRTGGEDEFDEESERKPEGLDESMSSKALTPYQQACQLFEKNMDASSISNRLGLTVGTIYSYKNRWKTENENIA